MFGIPSFDPYQCDSETFHGHSWLGLVTHKSQPTAVLCPPTPLFQVFFFSSADQNTHPHQEEWSCRGNASPTLLICRVQRPTMSVHVRSSINSMNAYSSSGSASLRLLSSGPACTSVKLPQLASLGQGRWYLKDFAIDLCQGDLAQDLQSW